MSDISNNEILQWRKLISEPYRPERLTVYLSNKCNCRCVYCYAADSRATASAAPGIMGTVSPAAVEAACRLVAENCAQSRIPLQIVLHGGGEPTLHWSLFRRLVILSRRVAAEAGVEWQGHVVTNGLIPQPRAKWIAEHLNSAGVSHDGLAALHEQQRPDSRGRSTVDAVEATIRIFRDSGLPFYVRCTLLREGMRRQVEIVNYLAGVLKAKRIHFEPVYEIGGSGRLPLRPSDAPVFVRHFLQAQTLARSLGATLVFSGTRAVEVHGPYCDVLRNVLHLVPGDVATACFFATDAQTAQAAGAVIGRWDGKARRFLLDPAAIQKHRTRAGRIPSGCGECDCVYHCVRGCPEFCAASPDGATPADSFRCRVVKLLASAQNTGSG